MDKINNGSTYDLNDTATLKISKISTGFVEANQLNTVSSAEETTVIATDNEIEKMTKNKEITDKPSEINAEVKDLSFLHPVHNEEGQLASKTAKNVADGCELTDGVADELESESIDTIKEQPETDETNQQKSVIMIDEFSQLETKSVKTIPDRSLDNCKQSESEPIMIEIKQPDSEFIENQRQCEYDDKTTNILKSEIAEDSKDQLRSEVINDTQESEHVKNATDKTDPEPSNQVSEKQEQLCPLEGQHEPDSDDVGMVNQDSDLPTNATEDADPTVNNLKRKRSNDSFEESSSESTSETKKDEGPARKFPKTATVRKKVFCFLRYTISKSHSN